MSTKLTKVCFKFIAAKNGASISYRSKQKEPSKRKCRQKGHFALNADKMAMLGPPDRYSNFKAKADNQKRKNNDIDSTTPIKKMALSVGNTTVTFTPNPHPEMMGKKVKVKFMVTNRKKEEWFLGIVSTYNGLNRKYGIFFPSDEQTIEMSLDDEDLKLILLMTNFAL